jgi:gluconolactonase
MGARAATAFALMPAAFAREQEPKRPTPYPDPAVEVVDPRFEKYRIGNAAVERLYTGAR